MSFNQYRTNPGQAVSNFKGRTDTPKAWPSTLVSSWMNGGLFGGDGINTWILLAAASSAGYSSTGKTEQMFFNSFNVNGTDTNPGTQSDGSMMVSVQSSNYNHLISVTSGGIIKENSFQGPDNNSGGTNTFHYFSYDEASNDLIYSGIQGMNSSVSAYQKNQGVRIMPGSNVDTTSTTISDLELIDPSGSNWTASRCFGAFITNAATKEFVVIGAFADQYCGLAFGSLNASNQIVWRDWTKLTGGDFEEPFQYFNSDGPGYYWYCWGPYYKAIYGRSAVFRSSGSIDSALFGTGHYKSYNYTGGGNVYGTSRISSGKYALVHDAQMTGNFDVGVTILTAGTGVVQDALYFSGSGISGSNAANSLVNLICRDSVGNVYVLFRRENGSVNTHAQRGELCVAKLNSSLVVQWIRIINASSTTVVGGAHAHYGFERPSGITISDDDNYLTIMGELGYNDANNRKMFMTRIPSDGSGYSALNNSGGAVNIGGTPAVEAGGSANWGGPVCYIRLYDNGDSNNWNTIANSTLSGNWTSFSLSNSVSTSIIDRTNTSLLASTNVANWYGNWPLQSWV